MKYCIHFYSNIFILYTFSGVIDDFSCKQFSYQGKGMVLFSKTQGKGRDKQKRDTPPSHYLLKLESFSSLSKASVEKYRSDFEAGGYKWELSIYPTGDKERDGEDHISIYLELMETSSFANGWEVNAIFNFFVYNQKQDKYVGLQDAKVRRFHSAKTQWGIAKFMDLKTLTNTKNGYIVKGTCTFGAEVFVANQKTFKGECVSMIKNPESYTYKWKINRFSSRILRKQQHESETFLAGKYKWTISFYPKGNEASKGNNISLFLALDTSTLPAPNTKLLVHYNLRVVDQINNQHFQRITSRFGLVSSLGYSRFMPLAKFKDPSNGFFVGDSCIIEADVQVLGVIKPM
ncbi:hypothetical protein UlMin_044564 [Ulmus minor]